MPRLLFVIFFSLLPVLIFAQSATNIFYFTGRVLDTDSIPVEHAYLVNYRNLRAYATDSNGQFKIPVYSGDSLKLVHISYKPLILKASPIDTAIIVNFEENMLSTVNIKSVDVELQNFNKNWETTKLQLNEMMHYNYRNSKVQNPYDANQFTGTTGIRISDIIDLFKKKK